MKSMTKKAFLVLFVLGFVLVSCIGPVDSAQPESQFSAVSDEDEYTVGVLVPPPGDYDDPGEGGYDDPGETEDPYPGDYDEPYRDIVITKVYSAINKFMSKANDYIIEGTFISFDSEGEYHLYFDDILIARNTNIGCGLGKGTIYNNWHISGSPSGWHDTQDGNVSFLVKTHATMQSATIGVFKVEYWKNEVLRRTFVFDITADSYKKNADLPVAVVIY